MRPHRLRLPACAFLSMMIGVAACDSPTGGGEPRFATPVTMAALGLGAVPERTTSELWVRGQWAYTGTHAGPVDGNVIKVWNVAGDAPVLVDSLVVPGPPEPPAALRRHLDGDEGNEN